MEFFDSIRQVNRNWHPYKKWEVEQEKNTLITKELHKKFPPTAKDLEMARQYGRTIVDNINLMDNHTIDKSEDIGILTGSIVRVFRNFAALAGLGIGNLIAKKRNDNKYSLLLSGIGAIIGAMFPDIIGTVWAAGVAKDAARIARYQTREKDLKDPRNFVIYNEKQIEEAKQIAKTIPDIREKESKKKRSSWNPIKAYKDAIEASKSIRKERNAFEKWKQESKTKELFRLIENKSIKDKEAEKSQKDQEVLSNTIKKIEIGSLNYLADMGFAISTIGVLTVLASFGISIIVSEFVGKRLDKYLSKFQKFSSEGDKKQLLNFVRLGGPFVGAITLLFIAMPYFVKLRKDAARVGRFKTKQELLNDPLNFIAYNDDQKRNVNNIEEPKVDNKGIISKALGIFKSIPKLKNDYFEYKEYMKTKYQDEQKLHEALKKVNVTDAQMTEATKLQDKAFHSFEKMDEMSQRYTEDIDAAMDVFRTVCSSMVGCVTKTIAFILGYKATKSMKTKDIIKTFAAYLSGMIISYPLALISTQIKKEAGKIGLMKAMQDLDERNKFTSKESA